MGLPVIHFSMGKVGEVVQGWKTYNVIMRGGSISLHHDYSRLVGQTAIFKLYYGKFRGFIQGKRLRRAPKRRYVAIKVNVRLGRTQVCKFLPNGTLGEVLRIVVEPHAYAC